MTFKNLTRMAFICATMAFLAPIDSKATITIDPIHKDRILTGPDEMYDWVEVRCLTHISYKQKIVQDFCDNSDIMNITVNPNAPDEYFIEKKHSLWVYLQGYNIQQSSLNLLKIR